MRQRLVQVVGGAAGAASVDYQAEVLQIGEEGRVALQHRA
jgi:hypothetical protein